MDFFDYFEITVLLLFYIVFMGRLLRLLAAGTNPFVLGSGKTGIARIIEASFMVGLMVWSFEVAVHSLDVDFHIFPDILCSPLFEMALARVVGTIVVGGGFIIFVLALISFGRSWRIGIDTENPGILVTTGIFSLTRNPIFLFLDMYFLGTWLIYPNLFFGIAAILTIGGIHWQILQEEAFLARQYGQEYEDYRKKVRRYI